jgi:hypothetical protein
LRHRYSNLIGNKMATRQSGSPAGLDNFDPTTDHYFPLKLLLRHIIIIIIIITTTTTVYC